MSILVAGGAGYIGSHACVELLDAGYDVVIVDNLCNSKKTVIDRIRKLTGCEIGSDSENRVRFYHVDIRDGVALNGVFEEELMQAFDDEEGIEAVINFAGAKAVGESVERPLDYYENNVGGAIQLAKVMKRNGVKNLIFSSSATVYGAPEVMPITEEHPVGVLGGSANGITNPYGRTKAVIEQILADLYTSDPVWNITLLRYFNPIGAHESGLIGEDPQGIPNNLVPYVAQVAVGKMDHVRVFGDDYPTEDGTGVRDYIHVVDLAKAHVKALEKILGKSEERGTQQSTGKPAGELCIYNLGTGRGSSVMDVIHAYEKACGKELPYKIYERRAGDAAISYCDASKAYNELGWKAEKSLEDMCADSWRWQSGNPNGYGV